MNGTVTIQQIADKLGVSKGLVSLALSDKYGVSEEMRSKIVLTAMKMDYPFMAKNYKSYHTAAGKLNVMLAFNNLHLKDDGYWARVMAGAERYMRQHHVYMNIMTWDYDDCMTQLPMHLVSSNCQGIVIIGILPPGVLELVKKTGREAVLVDSNYIGNDFLQIRANSYAGAFEAAKYLVEHGHRHICFVGDYKNDVSFKDRYSGFHEYISHYAPDDVVCDYLGEQHEPEEVDAFCRHQFIEYFNRPQKPTAVMCVNDRVAIDIYLILKGMGLRIPDDVSVVGFDDLQQCVWVKPQLTSVRIDKECMGEYAVKYLVEKIKNPEMNNVLIQLETTLMERQSVKNLNENSGIHT